MGGIYFMILSLTINEYLLVSEPTRICQLLWYMRQGEVNSLSRGRWAAQVRGLVGWNAQRLLDSMQSLVPVLFNPGLEKQRAALGLFFPALDCIPLPLSTPGQTFLRLSGSANPGCPLTLTHTWQGRKRPPERLSFPAWLTNRQHTSPWKPIEQMSSRTYKLAAKLERAQ